MKLFLQILSTLAVAAIIASYLTYRRCLRADYAAEKTTEKLKKEANISLTVMFSSLFIVILSAVLLRKFF